MARKSSTVINGINKKPKTSKGAKIKKPLDIAPPKKQAKGMSTVASKPVLKKRVKKRIALKSLSIEQELIQRNSELQLINSIQQGLAAELDFQAIVDLVGDKLREVFSTPDLMITWYEQKTNLVHYLYTFEHNERITVSSRPPTPGGVFERQVKTHQPVIWNTAKEGNAISPAIPGTDESKSGVSIPVISSDRVLGAIQMENYERENAYGESELRLLTTIAASLGTALENARLFDEVQRKNIEITEALEQQTATSEILSVMASSPTDIRPVLESVAQSAARLCDLEDASIYQVDSDELCKVASFGKIPSSPLGTRYPIANDNVAGRAVIEGKALHVHDLAVVCETDYPANKAGLERYGFRTVLSTPLIHEGIAIGVIVSCRVEVSPFSDRQIQLLQTFAAQAAIAIKNVRLFDETQRLLKITEDRAAELAIITSVQAALAAKLDMQGIYDAVTPNFCRTSRYRD